MPLPFPDYPAHAAFVAPARRRADFWRLGLGIALIVGVYIGGMNGLLVYLMARYGEIIGSAIFFRMSLADSPGAMLMLLFSFLGLAIGPLAAVRLLHDRRAGTLFGPSPSRAVSDFVRVLVPVLGFNLLMLPLALGSPDVARALPWGEFLGYLPFALAGILIQTGAEELVFRGYLQQQIAARHRSPLAWMCVPSALFAAAHYAPATWGPNTWLVTAWAAAFGIFAADLTARTGTLGAAIAFHLANNILAMLVLSVRGEMDGLALWSQSVALTDDTALPPLLLVDSLGMIVAWLIARLSLRV